MRVLVCSRSDPASRNIRDQLLAHGGWEATNRSFRGQPMWSISEAILVEVAGPSVHDEALESDLRATNLPFRDVWFLSKHAAASGQPSLTVHPIGNPGEAKFGGTPGHLSPSAPRDMGALLRRLAHHAKAANLPHQVTYEATHHGPRMGFPTLFVEIGSDETWYSDPAGGRVVADAITDVLGGEGRAGEAGIPGPNATAGKRPPIWIGLGGGHYVPRATDLGKAGDADFGHLIPTHALELAAQEGRGTALVRAAAEATQGCEGAHIHHKAMKGEIRREVIGWCAEAGVPVANP